MAKTIIQIVLQKELKAMTKLSSFSDYFMKKWQGGLLRRKM